MIFKYNTYFSTYFSNYFNTHIGLTLVSHVLLDLLVLIDIFDILVLLVFIGVFFSFSFLFVLIHLDCMMAIEKYY